MPGEPAVFTAGDTTQFTHTDALYEIDDWTLAYNFVNASYFYSCLASSGSGYDFSVSIAASVTVSMVPGIYRWASFVSKGVGITYERHQVEQGVIEVLPNWAAQTSGYDYRSHVKIVLDALEATLEGKASLDQMGYTIGGRSISRMAPSELIEWRARYRAEYETELRNDDEDRPNARRVLVRFTG